MFQAKRPDRGLPSASEGALQLFPWHPSPLAGPIMFEMGFGYVAQVACSLLHHADGLVPPAYIRDITLDRASPASCRVAALPTPGDEGEGDERPLPRGCAGPEAARPVPSRRWHPATSAPRSHSAKAGGYSTKEASTQIPWHRHAHTVSRIARLVHDSIHKPQNNLRRRNHPCFGTQISCDICYDLSL